MNFKNGFITSAMVLILSLLLGVVLFDGCKEKSSTRYKLTGDTVADGKNLVQIHCAKCHQLVPVNALTNDVWKYHALPDMAPYFSVRPYLDGYYKSDTDTTGLTMLEWQAIVAYYKKMAPEKLQIVKPPVVATNDWAGFKLKTPAPVIHPAYTTMVSINPDDHKIYTSDYIYENLTQWDSNLKANATTTLPTAAVNALFKKDSTGSQVILSCIGRMEPVDFPNGRVVSVNLNSKDGKINQSLIGSDLARPVQTVEGDFNKDGLNDLVVLGEGNLKGGVYLFRQNKDHSYTQSNISDKAGAVQAVTGDFDNDGWTDLMILFGNNDEGLWLFTNDHKGGFTPKNLLRFPPVYGSTSFQLVDIDHDGKLDLIYTCGYNFRDTRIMKPYHGLYIFRNEGNWDFKQKWFYPINGCTKAIAADFDGSGKLGIATIAFYADLQHNPSEEFIYFEQDKPFAYKAHSVPVSKYGRWLNMAVGDYNNDGKPDIILGNYSTGFLIQPDLKPFWAKNIPFIVLENNFKK